MKKRISTWADIQLIISNRCDVWDLRGGKHLVGWVRFLSLPLSYIITDVFGNFEYELK